MLGLLVTSLYGVCADGEGEVVWRKAEEITGSRKEHWMARKKNKSKKTLGIDGVMGDVRRRAGMEGKVNERQEKKS